MATAEGWLYLAVLLDLYSRKIVGYAMGATMTADLPLRALEMACFHRRPPPGLIHHTDRGSQYCSTAYRACLDRHEIVCSMSRRGECWDNAVGESFFGRLKDDLVYRQKWHNRRQLESAVKDYIETFYNAVRRHSSLGFMSPEMFEKLDRAFVAG